MSSPDPARSTPSIDTCLRRDQFRLRRERDRLHDHKLRGNDVSAAQAALDARIAASTAMRVARTASVPKIAYPDELPVSRNRGESRKAIEQHPAAVGRGETGPRRPRRLP